MFSSVFEFMSNLVKSEPHPPLRLNGMTLVEYCHLDDKATYESFFPTHMMSFVLKGEKRLYTSGEVMSVRTGDALLLKKGSHVMSELAGDSRGFESLLFFFEPILITEFLAVQPLPPRKPSPEWTCMKIRVNPLLSGFVQSVLPYLSNPEAMNERLLRLKFFELLYCLIGSKEYPDLTDFLHDAAPTDAQLMPFMVDHFTKPFTLEQYAKMTGRSLSAFKRDFTSAFKEPPGKWLRRKRLERAYFTLLGGERNVTELSLSVGYESVSHFIQAFRREFGVTPKQMAQKRQFMG